MGFWILQIVHYDLKKGYIWNFNFLAQTLKWKLQKLYVPYLREYLGKSGGRPDSGII